MNPLFKEIPFKDHKESAIKLIGDDWMLITAGNTDKYNTMTASWGGMGVLWNKPVMYIFIRPQRYTFEFVEQEDYFTCCFFGDEHREKLNFCGKYSGRDYDKAKEVNLTVESTPNSVYFKEARLIAECKKLYYQDINPDNFIESTINKHYPGQDFHRMYIGEITGMWIKN